MRILVAEDDTHTRRALIELLSGDGHAVLAAADGHEAAELFARERFEMACLDVMMPRRSGYDLCREFRVAQPQLPILFLTAKAEEIDKVVGLELGADDYIVKPFGSRELLARIHALARRCGSWQPAPLEPHEDPEGPFRFGPWEINPRQLRAHGRSGTISLTAREVRLLRMLSDHAGEVVSRRSLFNCGWGLSRVPNSRTLDQTISQLRKRIESDPTRPTLIQTVYGVGYRYDPS